MEILERMIFAGFSVEVFDDRGRTPVDILTNGRTQEDVLNQVVELLLKLDYNLFATKSPSP